MKLNRTQLRKIIIEALGIDTASKKREIGSSSFEAAQKDAKENGKAYFVRDGNEVIEFDSDGNGNVRTDMTGKDAYDANDGTVHYKGKL